MKTKFTFLLLLSTICSLAQQTGSFQQTVIFAEPDYNFTRTLYYYVPTDYDSAQSYKLVVGFRGGPHTNAGQFRDQLTFLSDSIGAIILCPENEGHFWNQEGLTKQLFQYSVDTTLSLYNIDTNFIYLTGLSYGGRHAVIVSMDTDNGLIPNLRGVIPFAAGSDSHLEPNYADIADFPPACICIGLNDAATFITVANTLHNDIASNGGTSFINEIAGVGHTVDFPSYPDEMMECFNFIESQYSNVFAVTTTFSNATLGNCDGTATSSATGGIMPYTYFWNTNPVQTDSVATGLCPGDFTVTAIDGNGDSSSTSIVIGEDPSGVYDLNASEIINVYPNPASTTFTISINPAFKPNQIYLVDVFGRVELIINMANQQVNANNLSVGIKTLIVVTDKTLHTQKISIIH
ncbi:MAG: hypothetical protein COB85_01615 [Bacteroidetes bacterium]|nr:MAG: hypothetical protein COB85_01615 [Bacteroidota bacterium]